MARYTSEVHIEPVGRVEERSIIPDSGTSVTVQYYTGAEWVNDPQSPITVPNTVFCRGLSMKLTPDVGGFFIDEGSYS